MRNRTKIALVLLSVSAAALAVFAGCSGEMTADEYLEQVGATDQVVTYYANGGSFDGTGNIYEKEIHYKPDSYVIGDFDGVQNVSVALKGSTFGGWYYVQTDAEGKPVTDAEGNFVKTDKQVDFSVKIKQGEHWYVYADWIPDLKVIVKLATDDDKAMSCKDGTVYEPDDEISYIPFERGSAVIDFKIKLAESNDYTFTQFFEDKECTKPVLGNIPMPEGENPQDKVIYAQYIKGNWNMVRESADVRRMFLGLASGNWYFCNMMENKVLDCSSIGVVSLKAGEIGARVEGNGFTVKNLTYTVNNTLTAGNTYSVFGRLEDSAVMRNLTFDGISVNVTNTRQDISLYLLSAGVSSSAVIENVTFKNVRLTIASNAEINNIGKAGEEYNAQNWLFGGEGTDTAFLAKFTGITVESAKLLIGEGKIEDLAENGKEYTFSNV